MLTAWLTLAGAARAGGPGLVLGATEDAVRSTTLATAKAQMDLLALAGFRAVRITQVWAPGERALSAQDKTVLTNVAAAAKLSNITVLTSVLNFGSKTTPLTDADQSDFAAYAADIVQQVPSFRILIVGNEPNLNRYWLPQFNADGSDAAAPAYESLLAKTYDAVKAAAPAVTVLGGAVSPRGGDVAGGIRPTHSPTVFIQDLGQAYRDSGRTTPIMDGFAFHPYEDNSSIAPVDGTHPNSTTIALADYDKLVALLTAAFGNDALPIWYDEFGVESQIPPAKQSLYTNTEPATTKPVPEATQADVLPAGGAARVLPAERPRALPLPCGRRARPHRLAVGSLLRRRHAQVEPRRGGAGIQRLETGHRRALQRPAAHGPSEGARSAAQCSRSPATSTAPTSLSSTACPGRLLVTKRGRAAGGKPTTLPLRVPVKAGTYRLRLSVVALVNPGPAVLRIVPLHHG